MKQREQAQTIDADATEASEAPLALVPPSEPLAKVTNVTDGPLTFTVLDEGLPIERSAPQAERIARATPPVERDPERWHEDPRTGQRVHPPKLYGPPGKQVTRQLRERRVEIAPKKSVMLPLRLVPALLTIYCDVCANGGDARGRCALPLNDEHRRTWIVKGAGLVSPLQVIIDCLKDVPIDSRLRDRLDEDAKATKANGWGRDFVTRGR